MGDLRQTTDIGSFFSLPVVGSPTRPPAPPDHIEQLFYISGRNAFRDLSESFGWRKWLLPNYLCASVREGFPNCDFYNVDDAIDVDIDHLERMLSAKTYDALLVIDYFGRTDPHIARVIDLCKTNSVVIVQDYTHHLFEQTLYGDICVASYRKTLPTPFGAIVRVDRRKFPRHRLQQTAEGMTRYLALSAIRTAAGLLANIHILKPLWRPMFLFSEGILSSVAYVGHDFVGKWFYDRYYSPGICIIRRSNLTHLRKSLEMPLLSPSAYFCGLVSLSTPEQQQAVRHWLALRGIYCPIYWPLVFPDQSRCNQHLPTHTLAIPVDQRYTTAHMDAIAEAIADAQSAVGPLAFVRTYSS